MSGWEELAKNRAEWDALKHDDPRLDAFAREVEKRYKLPPDMLVAIKNAGERTPSKASGKPTVSSAGAKGVMQFIDSTRKAYQHNVDDPFESIDAAGRLMADELKRWKKPMAAIAAYNGGAAQARPVKEGKQPPAAETQMYLKRIREYMDSKHRSAAK